MNDKIIVTNGFYFNPKPLYKYRDIEKTKDILILGRKEQSDALDLSEFKPDIHESLISRKKYLKMLSKYRIVISAKIDETFGFGPLEAAAVGSIPLTPDNFGYKETLPQAFRYTSIKDLKEKIRYTLKNYDESIKELNKIELDTYKTKFDEMIQIIKNF